MYKKAGSWLTPRHVDQVAPLYFLHPGKEVPKAHLSIFVVLTVKGNVTLWVNPNCHSKQAGNLIKCTDILRVPVRLEVVPLWH